MQSAEASGARTHPLAAWHHSISASGDIKAVLCIDLLKPSHPLRSFPCPAALMPTTEHWLLLG